MRKLVYFISGMLISLMYICFAIEEIAVGIFTLNIILLLFILLKARISIFSIKVFLLFYCLVPIAFQYWTGESYGILEYSNLPLEFIKINHMIFIYNFIVWNFIILTKVLAKEKKFFSNIGLMNSCYVKLIAFMGIVFIIIHYPPLFLTNGSRFDHLLPGNFWNHLSLICLLICLPKLKESHFVKGCYLFFILWCVFRHERVDALGLIMITAVYLLYTKTIKPIYFVLLIVPIGIGMILIGIVRTGIELESFGETIRSIVIQQTSSDIAYILNISVRYVEDFGLLYGKTYLSYIFEVIPVSNNSTNASLLLNDIYMHWGGIHLLSEPYMNFGFVGVFMFSVFECGLFAILLSKNTKLRRLYLYFIYAAIFRYCWYGIEYLFTGMIFLIPTVYVITNKTNISFRTSESQRWNA